VIWRLDLLPIVSAVVGVAVGVGAVSVGVGAVSVGMVAVYSTEMVRNLPVAYRKPTSIQQHRHLRVLLHSPYPERLTPFLSSALVFHRILEHKYPPKYVMLWHPLLCLLKIFRKRKQTLLL
jgi:hypothetical protein